MRIASRVAFGFSKLKKPRSEATRILLNSCEPAPDPKYSILFGDITEKDVEEDVSQRLKKKYLEVCK